MTSDDEKQPGKQERAGDNQCHPTRDQQSSVRYRARVAAVAASLLRSGKRLVLVQIPAAWRDFQGWNLNQRLTLVSSVLVAFATLAGATVAALQLRALRDANRANREAMHLTRRAFQMAHGAQVFPAAIVNGIYLLPNQYGTFKFTLGNIGFSAATAVTPIITDSVQPRGAAPSFDLPEMKRRTVVMVPGADGDWEQDFRIPAQKLSRSVIEDVLAGTMLVRVYGVVLYWDGFCRRCTSFCYYLDHTAPTGDGGVSGETFRCERRPDCTVYGNFTESACPQGDVSDRLGYYPATSG